MYGKSVFNKDYLCSTNIKSAFFSLYCTVVILYHDFIWKSKSLPLVNYTHVCVIISKFIVHTCFRSVIVRS